MELSLESEMEYPPDSLSKFRSKITLFPSTVFLNESDCIILNEITLGKIKDFKTLSSH